MTQPQERYISVDVETSGPIPGEFSLLSIGACEVYLEGREFECELRPLNQNFDPEAMQATGLDFSHFERFGIEAEIALRRFSDWLDGLRSPEDKIVFVGFNAAFDWSFINYYFHRFLGSNPFGFTALDVKSYYMGVAGCKWSETRSSVMDQHLKPSLRGSHDALRDAKYQAELFRLARATRGPLI